MSKYTPKHAARDTGSSTKTVSKAWHQARKDATSSGSLSERNRNKASDSKNGSILYSFFKSLGMTK
ncbi:MAG: hypothetical protein Q7R53_01575 [bacterium]|nr:hypothetical protein [bacterium]